MWPASMLSIASCMATAPTSYTCYEITATANVSARSVRHAEWGSKVLRTSKEPAARVRKLRFV